ncbi:dihydroxy-acid dehydratase [Ruminococcaceae bacterium OttesenSCG-928-I18]|nr:dihydroxy-acid dehydratase [Ruminococcaceae bacterium OttesenSCG-928-I18]
MGKCDETCQGCGYELRSSKILGRPDWSDLRAMFKGVGFGDDDLERPIIGVANTWSEINPGHTNLRMLADYVKRGIYRAGGTPVEFGTIGICDGFPTANEGMYYVLPSREVIADSIEVMTEANRLDGLVLLGSCDKIVPGILMAAARLNIPCIVVNGGPMLSGPEYNGRPSDAVSPTEAMALHSIGEASLEEVIAMEELCCPTCGSCSYLGTANTMCCLSEVMGMTLAGTAMVPAVYNERIRIAFASGEKIVELIRKGITSRDIITKESLTNAVKVLLAFGGSTNAVLHLPALAYEAGVDPQLIIDEIDKLSSEIPLIVKVNPSSHYDMEAFHIAGGVQQVMKEMRSILDTGCMTVDGVTVAENLDKFYNKYGETNRNIIKTLEEPFSEESGLAILRGNLAPDSGVAKPAAIHPDAHYFTGEAIVFDSEEECMDAIGKGRVKSGHVVVIRYEGPKGGPGMREMYKPMKLLYAQHLDTSTALITDGRFSGTNNGCFIGHISPEAANGGPIAIVRDGDKITIDIKGRDLHLDVTEEEMEERFKAWSYTPKKTHGYLSLYAKLASSADKGGIIDLDRV